MRIRQLENFIAVCELGSISRAAERRHVAQPALGLQIRGMEDEMGAQLLERHARGVQPTPAGLLVLEWARETVRNAQALKDQLRSVSSGLAGSLTLGMTPSIATAFAVPVLLAVQRELPNLRLQLAEGMGHLLRDWVSTGKVDVALVFDAAGGDADAADKLLTESLYFVCSASDPRAGSGPITMAEALEQPMAMAAAGDSVRKAVEDGSRSVDTPLKVEYELQSVGVILKLVRSGLASTVLPIAMVVEDVKAGSLRARRIESPGLKRHLRWLMGEAAGRAVAPAPVQRLVERVMHGQVDPLVREAYEMALPA